MDVRASQDERSKAYTERSSLLIEHSSNGQKAYFGYAL